MAFEMFKSRPEGSGEFKLFQGLINDELTVEDAVQWVIGATMDRLEGYGSGGTIDRADKITFMAILELAMRIYQAQYGPLVAFLKELKMYNAVDSTTGLVLKAQDGSWVWSHLPSLTTCARSIMAEFERDEDCKWPLQSLWLKANRRSLHRSMRPKHGPRTTNQMGQDQHLPRTIYTSGRCQIHLLIAGIHQ